jgi:hypothetical protein
MKNILLLTFTFLFLSCQKETLEPRSDELNMAVFDNLLILQPIATTSTLVNSIASNTAFRYNVAAMSNLYTQVRKCTTDIQVRALLPKFVPYVDAIRKQYGLQLGYRTDRQTIIRQAVALAYPPPPILPTDNYCTEQRKRAAQRCGRAMAADLTACAFAGLVGGGVFGFAACATGAGIIGWLCGYEADEEYDMCVKQQATNGGVLVPKLNPEVCFKRTKSPACFDSSAELQPVKPSYIYEQQQYPVTFTSPYVLSPISSPTLVNPYVTK